MNVNYHTRKEKNNDVKSKMMINFNYAVKSTSQHNYKTKEDK